MLLYIYIVELKFQLINNNYVLNNDYNYVIQMVSASTLLDCQKPCGKALDLRKILRKSYFKSNLHG